MAIDRKPISISPMEQANPYEPKTLVLGVVSTEVPGNFSYLELLSASAPDDVQVKIGTLSVWAPLYVAVAIEGFQTSRIYLRSTSPANTVVIAMGGGGARVRNNRLAPLASALQPVSIFDGAGTAIVLGQTTKSASLPVTIASDQGPLAIAGAVGGETADGAAHGAAKPVLIAGSDGANAQTIQTDTSGNQKMVGAVADGSAVGTAAPVMMAGTDGTNVKRVAVVADNVALPTSGNQTAVPGLYSSSARALTSGRVAFLSLDRGGKALHIQAATLDPVLCGYTATKLDAAAGTNGANLKNAPGMVYEVSAFNPAAYDVFIRLYDKTSAPTVGTDIAYRVIRVPAGQDKVVTYPGGAYFPAGLSYALTKLAAKLDATALVAGDLQMTIQWA